MDPIIEFDSDLPAASAFGSSISPAAAAAGAFSASAAISCPTQTFCLGANIIIEGLTAKPEMNGCTGVISGDCDPSSGRWTVRLHSGGQVVQLLPQNMKLAMGASSSQAAPILPKPVPLTSISSAAWPSILQQLQAVITQQAAASVRYYRNLDFAASLCQSYSESFHASGQAAAASQYAAACSTLHTISSGQPRPSSIDTLAAAVAQGQQVLPSIEDAQKAATASGDNAKASQLQALRCNPVYVDFAINCNNLSQDVRQPGCHKCR